MPQLWLQYYPLQESLNGAEDGGTPTEGKAGPRQPLHPLTSRASLAERLPPRPSELLKVTIIPMLLYCCLSHRYIKERYRRCCFDRLRLQTSASSALPIKTNLHVREGFYMCSGEPCTCRIAALSPNLMMQCDTMSFCCRMASWGQGSKLWQKDGKGGWCQTGL